MATSSTGSRVSGKSRDGIQGLSGWRIQWRVVSALTYRELRTKVSDAKGGFWGVLLQPLGALAIWMAFLSLRNFDRGGSLNIILFLGSGIILYKIFSSISQRSINAIAANEALLFYRPVKPIDTVIARAICETGLNTICLGLIVVAAWIYLDQIYMYDLGLFVISLLLASVLGFALGVIFMTGSYLIAGFSSFASWLPRILWFLSGIPYQYWRFPAWTRPFFVANPMMHCIELNRKSYTPDYFTPDANLAYPAVFAFILTTIALGIYVNNERRLLTL